jgi:hypothetical protein
MWEKNVIFVGRSRQKISDFFTFLKSSAQEKTPGLLLCPSKFLKFSHIFAGKNRKLLRKKLFGGLLENSVATAAKNLIFL